MLVQLAELVGDVLLVVYQFGHLVADGPVEAFYLGACLQVDDAVPEQVECLLAYVFGIVPVFEERPSAQLVPYLREVVYQLVVFSRGLEVLGHLGGRYGFQYVQNEHTVMGGKGTSALGNQIGVGDLVGLCCLGKGVHAVVHIFLDAVVDAAFAVAAACAVIVDTQSAAAVHKLDVEAHGMELYVKLCRLAEGCADAAYLGNLAADMEMNQFQAVAQAHLIEQLQGHEQFGGVEAELAGIAAALAPFSCAAAGQFDADAQVGAHTQLLCRFGDNLHLGQFFHYQEHTFAHLLGQKGQLDEVLVLVPVADDEAVAVHVGGQDSMQLWLGACFQPQVIALAVADDFFHHGTHLVHLNGEYDKMLALVAVFTFCLAKALVGLLDTVVEDVGEA